MSGIWSSEEWRAHHALLTGGRMGPLTGACSDQRHEDCSGRAQPGNKFCNCLVCHIQVRVIEQPADDDWPSVREAAADDRRWFDGEREGE